MNKFLLAAMAVALTTLLSCSKEENAVNSIPMLAEGRTDGNLQLVVTYNNQSDTVVVDSFHATVIGFNLFEVQAWSNGSLITDDQYTGLTATHSNDDMKLSLNPERGGAVYSDKSSLYLSASQGILQLSIQSGNITTSGTSIVGEDMDGF